MNNDSPGTFCERINYLFKRFKMRSGVRGTKKEYQMRIGASEGQLKGWLLGKSEPSFDMLKKIARIEGVSVSWLIGESEDVSTPPPDEQTSLVSRIATADSETLAKLEQYYNYLQYQKEAEESGKNKA